jgi:transposase-like protein
MLRPDRGIAAAQPFFRRAVATNLGRGPRKITLDGHMPSRRALWLLRREAPFWRHVMVRTNRFLNNIIEQDQRAIKRRCSAMHGVKSVPAATVTIAGIELAHRIRKRQFRLGEAPGCRWHSMLTAWNRTIFVTGSGRSHPSSPRCASISVAATNPAAGDCSFLF